MKQPLASWLPHHKKSNISAFATQKLADRTFTQQPSNKQILLYHDLVYIETTEQMTIALATPKNMVPGVLDNLKQGSESRFALFQIVPKDKNKKGAIVYGEEIYLQNKESGLFLASESQMLNNFTNIAFQKKPNPETCTFLFEHLTLRPTHQVYSNDPLKIKHKQSNLYLRTQIYEQFDKKRVSLWLSQTHKAFLLKIISRCHLHPNLLNSRDIIRLQTTKKGKNFIIGVSKHKDLYSFIERRDPQGKIQVQINKQYNHKFNCQVQQYSEDKGRGTVLMSCLWQVIRLPQNQQDDFQYLIKSGQDFSLRHLQTGLYLSYQQGSGFYLQQQQSQLSLYNLQRFSCQFSQKHTIQPLYISHPLKLGHSELSLTITPISFHPHITLFMQEYFSLIHNLSIMLSEPQKIGQEWQELQEQIKFYTYVWKLMQEKVEQMDDGGFFYFQYALRIVQLVRGLIQKGCQLVKRLLGDMLEEMVYFMALVVAGSTVLATITSQDTKKTTQIINLLFVLYPLNPKNILSLVSGLASADPQLVVSMLAQQLSLQGHYHQRVGILQTISGIIQRFRRVNFDQQSIQKYIVQTHYLSIMDTTLMLIYHNKSYQLFDLFQQMEKLTKNQKQKNQDQQEDIHQIVYILQVMRLLYGANNNPQIKNNQFYSSGTNKQIKDITTQLLKKLLQIQSIQTQNLILSFIHQFTTEISQKQYYNTNHKFVFFRGEALSIKTALEDVLKIKEGNTLEWLTNKQEICRFMDKILMEEWEEEKQLQFVLKFLQKVVQLLGLLLVTCTYDVQFLMKAEDFGIAVATLYYRKQVNHGYFVKTRAKICKYQHSKQLLIVQNIKSLLDVLIFKLSQFFTIILCLKQRLTIYPVWQSSPLQILNHPHFLPLYSRLLLNQRLSLQIPVLSQLLKLYHCQEPIQGIILSAQYVEQKCFRLVEQVVSDLESLAIIMESFRLFRERMHLKQNLIASIQQKIMSIEKSISQAAKYKQFNHYSEALNVPQQLLVFIMENILQSNLVYPLAELLNEKITMNSNLFTCLKNNRQFFRIMLQTKSVTRCSKVVLNWIGKTIEKMQKIPKSQQWNFIYEDLTDIISSDQQNSCTYFLISMLVELQMHCTRGRQILYAKMIEFQAIKEFLKSCSSFQTLATCKEHIEKHFYFRQEIQIFVLQLIILFRLTKGQEKLQKHLHSVAPLRQLKQALFSRDQFIFFLPILTYLSNHSFISQDPSQQDNQLIQEMILYSVKILQSHTHYVDQLERYTGKLFIKEREGGKASTQILKSHSGNFTKDHILPTLKEKQIDQVKYFYWEFLYWVPFYQQPEGLLVCLENILRQLFYINVTEQNQRALQFLEEALNNVKKIVQVQNQKLRALNNQISLLLFLLDLRKRQINNTRLPTVSKFGSKDYSIDDIFKLLNDSNLLKPFLSEVNKEIVTKESNKRKKPIKRQTRVNVLLKIRSNNQQQSALSSQSQSIQEHTHHSLIRPQKTQQTVPVPKISKPKTIISFLKRIKEQYLGHSLRVSSKLQLLLLRYFVMEGTFAQLQEQLFEQINSIREKAIHYKNDSLEYQWGWRQVRPRQQEEIKNQPNVQRQEAKQIIGFEVQRLNQILQNQSIQALTRTNLVFQTPASLLWQSFQGKYSQLDKLLSKMLFWNAVDETSLGLVLSNMEQIINLMLQFEYPIHCLSQPNEHYLNGIMSLFIRMTNIQGNKQNHFLFASVCISSIKIQTRIVCKISANLQHFCKEYFLKKLPLNVYRNIVSTVFEQIVQMSVSQKGIPIEGHLLPLVNDQMTSIINQMQTKGILYFARNSALLKKFLEYLQIVLSQKHPKDRVSSIKNSIMQQLIRLEACLYDYLTQDVYEDKNLYEDMAILCMSIFYTVTLNFDDTLDFSLYHQRNHYYPQAADHKKLSQICLYYESKYSYCVIRHKNGSSIVQTFPSQQRSHNWSFEFNNVIAGIPQISKRRQTILNYCLGVNSQSNSRGGEILYFLDKLKEYPLIISLILLFVAVIQKILQVTDSRTFFHSILAVHLILFFVVIVQNATMIYILSKIQVQTLKKQNLFLYILKNRIGFIIFIIALLIFNFVGFFFPGCAALALWQVFLFKNKKSNFLIRLFYGLKQAFLGLALFSVSFVFLLSMTIDPQHQQYNVPVMNDSVFYDINFTLPWIGIWNDQIRGKIKTMISVIFYHNIEVLLIALVIYHYNVLKREEKQTNSRCQLCNIFQDNLQKISAQKHISKRHNIFKFIACFKYVLFKPTARLTLQEQQIKQMVQKKQLQIFD